MVVSILGFGVVGKGVYDMLLSRNLHEVRNILVRPGHASGNALLTDDIEKIINDDSDLVVECMGGIDPAYEYVKKCLENNKNVVTANKALVASHGIDLMDLAQSKDKAFLFSASCGGSIPILQNLYNARQSDSILYAGGILNGTCNFILDSMDRFGLTFEDALKQAQERGYAEADPTADVSGLDTLRKVMVLSMVAFDTIPNSDYNIEGIQSVTSVDFEVARSLGCTIRLLGKTGLAGVGRLYAYVEPAICSRSSAYAGICSNTNLAYYEGKNCGFMTLSGQGAGRYPTASNVLRDIANVAFGQKRMLDEKCIYGFAFNGAKECEHSYLVRIPSNQKGLLEDLIGDVQVVCEKEDSIYAKTQAISVRAMHEAAMEIRRRGQSFFFAEYNEV